MEKFTALYARVSTANNQDNGLEAQVRALESFCKEKNISHYKIYTDKVSGAKSSRPQLDMLMKAVNNDQVKTVVIYSFSRFSRSTKHLLETSELFNKKEVEFVSLSEKIDTTTALGKAFYGIISIIAELEREIISERVKNGLKNARAKGKIIGRPKKRPSDAIINLYEQGHSYRAISKIIGFSHTAVAREVQSYKRNQNKCGFHLITL
jgi:DNA invertase Pin-like site-specific DNA recombinase